MRVKMKDNLILRYQKTPELDYRRGCRISQPMNELQAVKEAYGWMEYFKTKLFLKSIEDKVVSLVFTGVDAFEEKDNNIWLPDDLWEAI